MTKKKYGFDQEKFMNDVYRKIDEILGPEDGATDDFHFNSHLIGYFYPDDEYQGGFILEIPKELYKNKELQDFIDDYFALNHNWVCDRNCFEEYYTEFEMRYNLDHSSNRNKKSWFSKAYIWVVRCQTRDFKDIEEERRTEEFFNTYKAGKA